MRRNRRKESLPHYGQIVTTRHVIKTMVMDIDNDVAYNTAMLIALGRGDRNYLLRLYSICSKLCFLSRMVYRSRGGYRPYDERAEAVTASGKGFSKLPERYYDMVFTNALEYPEEAEGHLKRYNREYGTRNGCEIEITPELLDRIIRCRKLIAPICVRLMKAVDEQFFIGEYAYVFDYVLEKNGELPSPEYEVVEYRMDRHEPYFPCNYEDFDIVSGIRERFNEFDIDMYWM